MQNSTLNSFSCLSSLAMMAMLSFPGSASAQQAASEPTVVETGVATGIFYAFYIGERDIDHVPVAYQKYSDGSYNLTGFVNGKADLKVSLGEADEYNTYTAVIEDCEGVGAHEQFTYEGYEYWPFEIYRFVEPLTIGEDQIDFLFMDGSTYYDPASDTMVLDYVSAIDAEEYMFLIDFSEPFEGEMPNSITTVTKENRNQRYDLLGRRTEKQQKGFCIINGKKCLISE